MARSYALVLAFVILAASLALRTVALDTDAYGRLDWSAGLLTDEGFYTHNARNVALFGAPRTDERACLRRDRRRGGRLQHRAEKDKPE